VNERRERARRVADLAVALRGRPERVEAYVEELEREVT